MKLLDVNYSLNGINFRINHGVELISIIQILAKEYRKTVPVTTELDFAYFQNTYQYFSDFANHKIVNYFNEHINNGFCFDMPILLGLNLDDYYNAINYELGDENIKRCGGIDEVKCIYSLIKDFATKSNFRKFFEENKPLYNSIIERNIKFEKQWGFQNICGFFGYRKGSPYIVLSPLLRNCGFGVDVNGMTVCVLGFGGLDGDIPIIDESQLVYSAFHEFSHPYVNPLVNRNYMQFKEYEYLLDELKDKGLPEWYGDWSCCISEQLVRAITLILFTQYDNTKNVNWQLEFEEQYGFIHTRLMYHLIYNEYINNRNTYPVFDDFLSKIVEIFCYT